MYTLALAALLLLRITVVHAQSAATTWRLSPRPVLSLGVQEGKIPEGFGKVAGALRLGSGAIVVVDGMSLQVRFFSPQGSPLASSGKSGAGPGEFRTVMSVRRCAADSVFVYDPALMRISVFTPNVGFARSMDVRTWSTSGLPPYDFWCSEAGMLAFVHRSSAPPQRVGPRRPDVAITLVAPDSSITHLGMFPASERYFSGSEDFPRPFGKETSIAIGLSYVYVGTGEAFEVAKYSLSGRLSGTLREGHTSMPITSGHVKEYIARQMARRSPMVSAQALERVYQAIEYPVVFPPLCEAASRRRRQLMDGDVSRPRQTSRMADLFFGGASDRADFSTR
ncbi:MAG: hypothetical protein ACREX4_21165 [Gammaproteobacteria bacterium]